MRSPKPPANPRTQSLVLHPHVQHGPVLPTTETHHNHPRPRPINYQLCLQAIKQPQQRLMLKVSAERLQTGHCPIQPAGPLYRKHRLYIFHNLYSQVQLRSELHMNRS